MIQVQKEQMHQIKHFFKETKYHMGRTVLEGYMGEAYTDNKEKPNFAVLFCRRYCFINGDCQSKEAEKFLKSLDSSYRVIIADSSWYPLIEKVFQGHYEKNKRYALKEDGNKFEVKQLEENSKLLDKKYVIKEINEAIYKTIQKNKEMARKENADPDDLRFLNLTDNYLEQGIGVCCFDKDEIIGICGSSIIYSKSIEINIKVKEEYHKQHIATVMASQLILRCLEKGIYPSWDAANLNSLGLAKKLGYQYDSEYEIYEIYLENK